TTKLFTSKQFLRFFRMFTMLAIIFASLLLIWIYIKVLKPYEYWKNKGVTYVKPWPLFGNMAPVTFRRKAFAQHLQDLYSADPNKRYIGFYQFLSPTLLIRDPDLIKTIAIKEFSAFPDHRTFTSEEADPLGSRNLFALTAAKGWHDLRATISPAFTTSKMKLIFGFMDQCADQFVNYFKKQEGTVIFETKDAFSRFTNDVIGSTVFGINCDSLEDRENEFYLNGKSLADFSGIKALKFFLSTISPGLVKFFKITFFDEACNNFYRDIIKNSIKIREEKQIVRPDMIHLLLEARKGRLKHEHQNETIDSGFAVAEESEIGKSQNRKKAELTDEDITAQAVAFYFAGFDAVSTLMSFISYELALNTDIQDKLREEINAVLENNSGKITYEAVLGMKYLDCVISEGLRKWPGPFVERVSARDYTIQPKYTEEKPLHLKKGSVVWFPLYPIHRDPENYPEPEKFDPERFNEENKRNIKPFTYIPFGAGPRNCIASRFALLEAKVITVKIIENFEIVPVVKTKIPLEISKSRVDNLPDDGIWLGLKPRKNSL
ncbi:hypothetical protein ILUMI_20977, partial [Ignelater luminosus]